MLTGAADGAFNRGQPRGQFGQGWPLRQHKTRVAPDIAETVSASTLKVSRAAIKAEAYGEAQLPSTTPLQPPADPRGLDPTGQAPPALRQAFVQPAFSRGIQSQPQRGMGPEADQPQCAGVGLLVDQH